MRPILLCSVMLILMLSACYREEIQFEGDPPDSYTRIVRIDTVTPQISTVVIDSFVTGGATDFLLGGYTDPYFGTITARPFFQLGGPDIGITIPENAAFDSLVFIIKLNKYWYGDTTAPVTIDVHELDESIALGYNDELYSNSNFSVKPTLLGSRRLLIYPNIYDSIIIRLDDAKGIELFNKLIERSDDLFSTENFVNYFKGIRISTASASGERIIGLAGAASDFRMRLYYHTTSPLPEERFIDFSSLANTLAFRQILVNRNGAIPDPATTGRHEFLSTETGNQGFTQAGTGVLAKIVFPGLRNILSTDKPVNLLHAELLVQPVSQSFNPFLLPPSLSLAQTDESNFIGNFLADSTGQAVLSASPVIDQLYGLNSYYRFNVTNYINQLLNTPGSAGTGFYLLDSPPEGSTGVHRAVIGDAFMAKNKIQLVLSVVTVNIDL